MTLPNREDCTHACVCKYDDAMCPMDCGHFADYAPDRAIELADQILVLIERDRCEWIIRDDWEMPRIFSSCGDCFPIHWRTARCCPYCGRKIEVKDEQGENI